MSPSPHASDRQQAVWRDTSTTRFDCTLGKSSVTRLAVTCLLAQGHLLIEDARTRQSTLALALAKTFGLVVHQGRLHQ